MTTPAPLPEIRKLWKFDDPAGTEARFREILPAARASGDREYLAELLSQIARTQGLQLRFDDAEVTLSEAESFLGAATTRASVLCLLERGRTRNSSKRKPEALPYFLKAWDAARAAGLGGLAVDAAHMVAIAETPENALTWNERAIAYAEESQDPAARAWLGSLYNNTGWDHHRAGRLDRALTLFEKALRTQEALRAETEAAGAPDGYVYEELGECLLALGRGEEARPWFGKAHALLAKDAWIARDEPERLARMLRLA